MMLTVNVIPALLLTAVVGVVLALTNILGSWAYDIKELEKQKKQKQHPFSRAYRQRPLISVIIPARNNAATMQLCLESMYQSSYRKIEIIVIDNVSHDATRKIVHSFILNHPKFAVRLVAKRKSTNRLENIRTAYQKYAHGKIVMVLSPESILDKQALKNAVKHFNSDSSTRILVPHLRTAIDYKVSGLLQVYKEFTLARWKKFSSMARLANTLSLSDIIVANDSFATLLKSFQASGNSSNSLVLVPGAQTRAYYASDVAIMLQPPRSFYQLCKRHALTQFKYIRALTEHFRDLFRGNNFTAHVKAVGYLLFIICLGVVCLLLPLIATYFIYLTFSLHEPGLLLFGMGIVSIFVLSAVWSDELVRVRRKLLYTLLLPVTFGVAYVMAFLQIIVIIAGIVMSLPVSLSARQKLIRQQ